MRAAHVVFIAYARAGLWIAEIPTPPTMQLSRERSLLQAIASGHFGLGELRLACWFILQEHLYGSVGMCRGRYIQLLYRSQCIGRTVESIDC
jgi:hypothetical protein